MAASKPAVEAAGAMPAAAASSPEAQTVRVWDPFVRLFHWSLVGLFVLAFTTGDEIEWLHIRVGYAIAALVALRVVWGFVGSRHVRFSDFVRSPREIATYLHRAARCQAPRYLGHNPAGGAMVVALLVTIAGIAATGFAMTTDAFWGAQWMEDLHEGLVYTTIGLIALHVAGIVFSSLEHGENLVKAMITGRKRAS
ncbi:cytochrome b/b6 domain-containing protein [Methylobacterium nodulans]|uniref:Cytochrome B561 n=1 Tax=Methylobacterium nodulans (strain LMG 21967 / CNCM I-2342 / ORS 2060) TaxID=460265 RepID=B8IVF0_METNO|nr:cytochrome b/b6 domain-containing protein [Methylobacterium nodulans]ACL61001.1 cytochrome B561 [Methylobacterium nodulans ORS 2060]